MIPALTFTASYIFGHIADQGLSNTLGLATLRHGTNPLSWISIHIFGALPSMGGSSIGGDYGQGYDRQNRGRFYFAKDFYDYAMPSLIKRRIAVRALPVSYAVQSTYNFIGRILPVENKYLKRLVGVISGVIGAILPTIKFRFHQTEVNEMVQDPTITGACSTDCWVSPLKIGIVGTVWQSLTWRTPIGMIQNPYRVITGIAQLALVGLACYAAIYAIPAFIIANKVALVAGVVLSVI